MKNKSLIFLTTCSLSLPVLSADFMDELKNALPGALEGMPSAPGKKNTGKPELRTAGPNGSAPSVAPAISAAVSGNGSVDGVCKAVFGKPFKEKTLSAAPEELVKKYMNKTLQSGSNVCDH